MTWEEKQAAQQESQRQLMALFEQQEASLGGILSLLKTPPAGDVQAQLAGVIPASGFYVLVWPVRYRSVALANLSPALMSVGHSATGGNPPSLGAGVTRIPPGRFRAWSASGDSLTIWGAPGASFDLVVYLRPRPPSSGPCGIAGGLVALPAGTVATATSPVFATAGLTALGVVLNVSAVSGGETVAVALYGLSSSGYLIPLATIAAQGAVGAYFTDVGPGFANAHTIPPQVYAVATIVGTGAVTFGVDLYGTP
jgi:hypothetical protein